MTTKIMEPHLIRYLERAATIGDPESGGRFLDRKERETWYTWREGYDRVQCVAGALHDIGVRKGDRVAIILPTCIEFLDAYLGCMAIGAVPVPLYPPVRLGRMQEYFEKTAAMLSAVDACALVVNSLVKKVIGKVLPLYSPRLGLVDAEPLHTGVPRAPDLCGSDELAMVQFSSGTTLSPKAVALTQRQMLANAQAIMDRLLLDHDEVPKHEGVSWLPLYHDMGLIGCLFPAIMDAGVGTLISPEIFLSKPAIWLRAMSRYGVPGSAAPNFAYGLCTERIKDREMEGCDLSSWQVALCGAEPVSMKVMKDFHERFSQWGFKYEALTPVYGLSEASLAVTFTHLKQEIKTFNADRKKMGQGKAVASESNQALELVSVGTPLPGFAVEVRDKEGHRVDDATEGTVFASGPSLCMGYLSGQTSPISDGWLDTGDLGLIIDGDLYITGREKDLIIINGQNHAPHDIEQSLDAVPGIRVGCAAAVGDTSETGEKLLIFVEYREYRDNLADDCRKAVLKSCNLDPELLVLLEPGSLPRTSSGKIRRAETLKLWKNEELTPPDKVTPLLLAGAMTSSLAARFKHRLKKG